MTYAREWSPARWVGAGGAGPLQAPNRPQTPSPPIPTQPALVPPDPPHCHIPCIPVHVLARFARACGGGSRGGCGSCRSGCGGGSGGGGSGSGGRAVGDVGPGAGGLGIVVHGVHLERRARAKRRGGIPESLAPELALTPAAQPPPLSTVVLINRTHLSPTASPSPSPMPVPSTLTDHAGRTTRRACISLLARAFFCVFKRLRARMRGGGRRGSFDGDLPGLSLSLIRGATTRGFPPHGTGRQAVRVGTGPSMLQSGGGGRTGCQTAVSRATSSS